MPATIERPGGVQLLSRGEMLFAEDVSAEMRETIGRMWVNRLTGCNRCRLGDYLKDNDESTRYEIGRRKYGYRTFRRSCRALFLVRKLLYPLGIRMSADVADLAVWVEGGRFVSRGVFTIKVAGRVMRVGEVRASVVARRGKWVWDEIVETRIARSIREP